MVKTGYERAFHILPLSFGNYRSPRNGTSPCICTLLGDYPHVKRGTNVDPRNGKKKEANYHFWGLRTMCTGLASRPAPEMVKNIRQITVSGIRGFTRETHKNDARLVAKESRTEEERKRTTRRIIRIEGCGYNEDLITVPFFVVLRTPCIVRSNRVGTGRTNKQDESANKNG